MSFDNYVATALQYRRFPLSLKNPQRITPHPRPCNRCSVCYHSSLPFLKFHMNGLNYRACGLLCLAPFTGYNSSVLKCISVIILLITK